MLKERLITSLFFKMYNILLVEDEYKIAETVIEYLKINNFNVTHVSTIVAATEAIGSHFDLIILDLMLPDGNGEDFCSYVTENYNVPVIILTAKKSEESRINGFACGADDYLIKPFSPRELVARVKAILKRTRPTDNIITLEKEIVINLSNRTITKKDKDIKLTSSEYNILICLINNYNSIVSREKLIENIKSYDSSDRAIDVHIRRLRSKLEDDTKSPEIIKTVHGHGYKLGIAKIDSSR